MRLWLPSSCAGVVAVLSLLMSMTPTRHCFVGQASHTGRLVVVNAVVVVVVVNAGCAPVAGIGVARKIGKRG